MYFIVYKANNIYLGRPEDHGYPIRGIVTHEYIYLRNYHPERWPAGNPETGYMDTDGSPTKTWILNDRRTNGTSSYWDINFGKRPAEELYNVSNDPECVVNLAEAPDYQKIKQELIAKMDGELKAQGDPRQFGNGDIFDTYEYSEDGTRNFYERFMSGENVRAGWIQQTDIEKGKLD